MEYLIYLISVIACRKLPVLNDFFSVFAPHQTTALTGVKFGYILKDLTPIGQYLGIFSRKKLFKIAIFCLFFAPHGRIHQPIFLKFTGFMRNYSPRIRLKSGEIWFINKRDVAEKLCIGRFFPKLWGPLAQKLGVGSQNNCLWIKWYRGSLFTCHVWWRSVYAQWHETKRGFFVCHVGMAYFGLACLPRCLAL